MAGPKVSTIKRFHCIYKEWGFPVRVAVCCKFYYRSQAELVQTKNKIAQNTHTSLTEQSTKHAVTMECNISMHDVIAFKIVM